MPGSFDLLPQPQEYDTPKPYLGLLVSAWSFVKKAGKLRS
jgi:hypothetical protein